MSKNIVKLKFSELDQFNLRPYGTCSTAAATAAKVVTCLDFVSLVDGATVLVKFTNSNNIDATLNVNNTGAKSIINNGVSKGIWDANEIVEFIYNGTAWEEIRRNVTIPTNLPNEKTITFTKIDGTEVSYNGSSDVDLTDGILYAATSGVANSVSATNVTGAPWLTSIEAASDTKIGGFKTGFTASGAKIPVKLESDKALVELTSLSINSAIGGDPATQSWVTTLINNAKLEGDDITIDYPVTDVKVNGTSVVTDKVANITISDSDTKCTSLTLSQGTATTPSEDIVEVIENKNIIASGTGTSLTGTLTAVSVPTKAYTDKTFATITLVNDYTQVIAGSLVDLNDKLSYHTLDIERRYIKPSIGIPFTDLSESILTSLNNADTAFGWGDHNNKYLSLEGGTVTGNITALSFSIPSGSNDYVLLAGGGTKLISELVGDSGITSESDPIFLASAASEVTESHVEILNNLESGQLNSDVLQVTGSELYFDSGLIESNSSISFSSDEDNGITFITGATIQENDTKLEITASEFAQMTADREITFSASDVVIDTQTVHVDSDLVSLKNSLVETDTDKISLVDRNDRIVTILDNSGISTTSLSADTIKISGGTDDFVLLAGGGVKQLDDLATKNYVSVAIAEAELSGGDVDLSGYATKDDLSTLAKKSDLTGYLPRSGGRMTGALDLSNTSIKFDDSQSGEIGFFELETMCFNVSGDTVLKLHNLSSTLSGDLIIQRGESSLSLSNCELYFNNGGGIACDDPTSVNFYGFDSSLSFDEGGYSNWTSQVSTIHSDILTIGGVNGSEAAIYLGHEQNNIISTTDQDSALDIWSALRISLSADGYGIYLKAPSISLDSPDITSTGIIQANLSGYADSLKVYSGTLSPNEMTATEFAMLHNYGNSELWSGQVPENNFGRVILFGGNGYLTGQLYWTPVVVDNIATTGNLYWRCGDPGRNTESENYWDRTLWKQIAFVNDIDNKVSNYLPLSGGTISGDVNFNYSSIYFDEDCAALRMNDAGAIELYGESGIMLSGHVDCDGSINCSYEVNAQAFYETSDARKKDIKSDLSLDKCYDLIDKCQTVIYSLKDQTKEQVGMIAQEIEEFFPEVVATDNEGFKSLAYDRLVVICFKVLKDVIKRLEKLEQ